MYWPLGSGLDQNTSENGAAVVLAFQLYQDAADVAAAFDRFKQFLHPLPCIGPVEMKPTAPCNSSGFMHNHPLRGVIGADEARLQILMHVRDRRLIE